MPPKRPTKAIEIVNPNPPQQPAALPQPPPLPSLPTARPRINPGYEHLKSIIESLDLSLLPNPERTFQAHSAAQAAAQRKPKSSSKKTRAPSMQKEKGENLTSQTDPLLYALTNIFLPYKKETTSFLNRFETLYANTTQEEWDLTSKWKVCTEMNAHTLKTLHAQHGPDAVVSLAMKRWVQRVLGLTLEEIFASQNQHANQHPIGLSAVYSGDPLAPPVYHYSEQQMYNTYTGFPYHGKYSNRNMYHPQRTPLPPLRNPQPRSVLPRRHFAPSRNQNTLHHSASLPAFPRAPAPAPNSDNEAFKYEPKLPVAIEIRPQRRPVARATSPVPNPSGRNTPPHKRSPKKKKKPSSTAKAGRTKMDAAHGSLGSTGYDSQSGKSILSRSDKWAKGRGALSDDEGSSAVIQSQDHAAETTTRALTKGKEKEHATNYADNGEGSSMDVTDTVTSQLVVKTLPNGKKQVLAKARTAASTGDGSSIIYDTQIPGWKKVDAQQIPKPAQNPQSTNPENKNQTSVREDLEATTLERDINRPGKNATVKRSNRVEAGDRVSVEVKSSGTAINQVPTKQLAHGHPVTRASVTAKMLVGKWAKEKQQSERGRKGRILNDVEGSFSDSSQTDVKGKLPAHGTVPSSGPWLTNDPRISGLMAKTSGSSSVGGSELAYAQGSLGPGENADSRSPAPVRIPEVPTSTQYEEMDQPPPYGRAAVMPRTPDSTKVVMDPNGKTNTPMVLIPIRGPAPVCPSMFPASPPDYAKAATGVNGKNMDKRTPDRTLSTTPTWKPSPVPVTTSKFIATPIKLTASPPAVTSTLAQNTVSAGLASLGSGKSWSSIVVGNTDSNAATKDLQQSVAAIGAFPVLGKPLSTLPSNQLPTAEGNLKKKSSLSATAKPFEPAALRHAASVDSYLGTTNYSTPLTVQQPTPIAQQFPMSPTPVAPVAALRAPADYMNFSFDYLLEIFYDTPQFTQYLNRSYNELLFTENYLRAQYQRISTVFEDEWDYITASQRKAVVAKALFNLSNKVDKVQFREGNGVENMLREMGLAKTLPNTPVVPVLRRAPNSNLREAYIQGASATEKEEKKESAGPTKVAYLRWRAEYCFDLDPDALSITPDWLFSIIAWLLGMPHPLRHRFGPGRYNRGSGASAASDHGTESTPGEPEFWCPDDCSECAESEQTGWSTEWTFVRRDSTAPTRKVRHSNLGPNSPMLERFLDEMEIPEGYLPEPAFPNPPGSQKPMSTSPSEGYSPFMFSQPSILKVPRLMSNRFIDPIFHIHNRSDEWKANNPGRAKFMEILNIDTALFYCALIEEILKIFGEVRRERVWFKLPTGADYYDALSWFSNTQPERGRPRARSEGEGSSRIRSIVVKGYRERLDHRSRRAEVQKCLDEEQERVQKFVKETQRSADWLVSGLKLVNKDTDKEVGRARDGGLWTVPVPPGERESLEEEFAKLLVWEV